MLFRWIIDGALNGVTNMARDEALLQRIGRGDSPPTLRFYRWDPPTISLGYFQSYADYERLDPPAGTLAMVRRQTGGGAILHDLELTYSLILPLGHELAATGGPSALYNHVHTAFSSFLLEHGVPVQAGAAAGTGCSHAGPFFCFERHSCFDLLLDGKKLMGSAQRRTSGAILQHGSLVLDSRFDQQHCATLSASSAVNVMEHLSLLAGRIARHPIDDPGQFTTAELELAEELKCKYAGEDWNRKR